MRLFTAITFEDQIKDSLWEAMEKLSFNVIKGSFTAKDNLHLTLNFIGETKKIELVKEAMEEAVFAANIKSFNLSIGGFGRFSRRDGDICFIGVKREENLLGIQKELTNRLKSAGFDLENREYKPHITLARRVRFAGGFRDDELASLIVNLSQKVQKISLMKSEHINGRLTYTEIFHVCLP
ncbi:RNA 2',3'-cyclic phosphodiesterase [Herbinix luporum]|uniref:RNA 2',3'-cyclic phosphodiesterase n=1 Tax=Herbinix luporum TaxID=1679721 RepID=A0A0K8J846_9FIRM|nr:RNA 2',3'-cyclic phosphodiesterase [Herbinix luporum]CUH93614.1 hypothetical protein SD1D_2078 [Herbinix luporum]